MVYSLGLLTFFFFFSETVFSRVALAVGELTLFKADAELRDPPVSASAS